MPENLMQNRREAEFRKPFCYPQKTFGERPDIYIRIQVS